MNPLRALEAFERRRPKALELGMVVSPAARVDITLLRMARLTMVPRATAADEAHLWFSTLATSRNTLGFTLEPEVVNVLRDRLAQDPQRLQRSVDLVMGSRRPQSPLLRFEEELVCRFLADPEDKGIEHLLRRALATLYHGDDERWVAGWACRAIPNLPERLRQRAEARMLLAGAAMVLGDASLLQEELLGERLPAGISSLASIESNVALGVRFVGDDLELGSPEVLDGSHRIDVPATWPLIVELSWTRDGRKASTLVQVTPDEISRHHGPCSTVELRTLSGGLYRLTRM